MERVEVKYFKPVPRQPDSWPPVRICGPSFCGASYTVGTSLTPCRQLFGRLSVLELITCEITLIGCSATFLKSEVSSQESPLSLSLYDCSFNSFFSPAAFFRFPTKRNQGLTVPVPFATTYQAHILDQKERYFTKTCLW